MAQPFFSVLIPVYNAEKYLDACLEALTNQHFPDYEIVLVDDGSKDSSGELCQEWVRRFPEHIRLIRQSNRGVAATREVCLRQAKGQYMISVDSDDILHPDAMTVLQEYIRKYNADVVLFKASTEPDYSNVMWEYPFSDGQVMNLSDSEALRRLMGATFRLNNLWSKVFRRELALDSWDAAAIAHIHQGEDLVYSLPVMDQAERIVYCDRVLYYYRPNPGSITNNYKPTLYQAMRDAIRIQRGYAEKWDTDGNLVSECDRNALVNFYDVLVKIMLSQLSLREKRRYTLEMIRDEDFLRAYSHIGQMQKLKIRFSLILAKHRIFAPLYLYGALKGRR